MIFRSIQVCQLSWWYHFTLSYQSPTSWSFSYSSFSWTATFHTWAITKQFMNHSVIQIFFHILSSLSSFLPFSCFWTGIRNMSLGQLILIKEQSPPWGLFYECRMEWIWRERLKGEEEGVDTMQGINKVLLENLLPAHVARHFLTNIKVHIFCWWFF